MSGWKHFLIAAVLLSAFMIIGAVLGFAIGG